MDRLNTEIRVLVGRLNNLHEIFRVQGEILSYGEATVEPLAELLLSPPSIFPEPRVAAADCLGAIGGNKAVAALIRVLDRYDLGDLGPVQRFAEEAVRNAAARRLARFRQTQVTDALLASFKRDHLIGAGEALTELKDARAIPYLIECLEDDYKKEKAIAALRQFGQAALPYLCDAIRQPRFVAGVEPPLSQERRSRAADLLGQLKAREALPALKAGLREESKHIRIACSLALVGLGEIETQEVVSQLIPGLDDPDLIVRKSCEEALQKLGNRALRLLGMAACSHAIHVTPGCEIRLSLSGRLVAIKLLGLIPDEAGVRCLTDLLKDPEEIVRYRAIAALEQFADGQTRAALKRVAREDVSGNVRRRAKTALGVRPER